MCDLGEFFSRIITKPGTGGQEAQAQIDKAAALQSQQATQQQIAAALDAQQKAQAAAVAAADTANAQVVDQAAQRKRRLADPGAIASFFSAGANTGPVTAGSKMLFGS